MYKTKRIILLIAVTIMTMLMAKDAKITCTDVDKIMKIMKKAEANCTTIVVPTPTVPAPVVTYPIVVHGKSYISTNKPVQVFATLWLEATSKPLPNTEVRIVATADGWSYTVKTNAKGYFEFNVTDRHEFYIEVWDKSIKKFVKNTTERYNINIYNNFFVNLKPTGETDWMWVKPGNASYGLQVR
jgi:hypothetical protein